jgi:predicted kinase
MPPQTFYALSMPRLLLLIGLPGSGKSSLARSIQHTGGQVMIISTDAIRAKLFGNEAIQGEWSLIWREVKSQFEQAVRRLQPDLFQLNSLQSDIIRAAIYDATNAKRSHRKEVITLARSTGFTQITAIWFDVPLSICLQRNQQRDRQVPNEVILRMSRQLSDAPPSLNEDVDGLIQYKPVPSYLSFSIDSA